MTETINKDMEEEPLQPLQAMKDLTARWADYFNGIQRVLEENGTGDFSPSPDHSYRSFFVEER